MQASTTSSVLGNQFGTKSKAEYARETADGVVNALDLLRWKPIPVRPMNLPEELQMLEIVEASVRGEQMDKTKERMASTFGSWRCAVWKRELDNVMNACLLVASWRTLDELGRTEDSDKVVEALSSFGGIDWGKAPTEFQALLRWAKLQLTDTLALSLRLRNAGTR